jgi:hypothetical protein
VINRLELVGKLVSVETADEDYIAHTVVSAEDPIFIILKNRAGTLKFVAWNAVQSISYTPPEKRRKPRASKASDGAAAPAGEPGPDEKVH